MAACPSRMRTGQSKPQDRTSAAVQTLLGDIFRANSRSQDDPIKARDTTARELLDLGAKKINAEMSDAPAAKLRVLQLMSQLYSDLALDDEAVRLRRQTVQLARVLHGSDSTEAAGALVELSIAMHASNAVNERLKVLVEATAILGLKSDLRSETRGALLRTLSEHYQSSDTDRALNYAQQAVRRPVAILRWPELQGLGRERDQRGFGRHQGQFQQ